MITGTFNISYIIMRLMSGMISNSRSNGKFGKYGGKYIPETLVPAIEE